MFKTLKMTKIFEIYNKALTLIMGKVYHKRFFQKSVIFAVLLSVAILSLSVYIFMSLTNIKVSNVLVGNNKKSKDLLEVHFLNIGQGDAIYIVAPNKNSMLIDSGPQNEKVISEIQKFKSMFDRRLDVLLATHADADHIGSMKKVIEKFQYQIFAHSGLSSDTKLYADMMRMLDSKDAKKIILTAGMSIVLDEKNNIRFDVLFPDFDYQIEAYQECIKKEKNKFENSNIKNSKKAKSQKVTKDVCIKYLSTETNLNSVVGKLSHGSTSFMLTGDAPMEVERFIIEKYKNHNSSGKLLQSDVLKLGHHGSKTSTSPEFLSSVAPDFAVVSAGKDNRYGHPHKKVLDNLDAYKKTSLDPAFAELKFKSIYRTDQDGTISFYSDDIAILAPLKPEL